MVSVRVQEDKIPDFLKVMEEDARGSRAEPGCHRFDLLKDAEVPQKSLFDSVPCAVRLNRPTSDHSGVP